MGRSEDKEHEICVAIKKLTDACDADTPLIKRRWRENYDMFAYGTQTENKEAWQTDFSVNKLNTSIRTAQGKLVNTLVNTPDWFELCPTGYSNNPTVERLAPTFKKILDYYLDSAKFKRHAGTFFMCSLISSGAMHVGWKQRLVQNPEYVLAKTEAERRKEQERLASKVTNPQVEDSEISPQAYGDKLNQALDDFMAEAQGQPAQKKDLPPYVQIGCLDFLDINHERQYWDTNVMYMEDSGWRAFDYDVNMWEINHAADLGFFSKSAVKKIKSGNSDISKTTTQNLRYKNVLGGTKKKTDLVKLTVYYGPLIIDDQVEKEKYFCVIANDSVILKDGEYPFWEPPGHSTPVITAAVRQIPYRATGAGIGDNAVKLQRVYDSNWQLVCDTFRYGISGINIVNWQNLVDKSQLEEGVYPGMTLDIRGKPADSFQHIDFTSNIENQAHPVQNMLENAIDSLTGINELMVGGGNPYSRTPAAETNARLQAGTENVNIIALDLESNFLVPALEKCFARILQFGIPELNSNPELQSILDEDELALIQELSAGERLKVLNQWYRFKVKGFSSKLDSQAQAQIENEFLQIVNSGGVLSQLINTPELLKDYFKNQGIKDPERLLIVNNSPLQMVTSENEALMSGHMVMPSPNDDHQFHINNQGALAQSAYATPEMRQHVQIHMQALQQMQMAQQAQQAPGSNPTVQ